MEKVARYDIEWGALLQTHQFRLHSKFKNLLQCIKTTIGLISLALHDGMYLGMKLNDFSSSYINYLFGGYCWGLLLNPKDHLSYSFKNSKQLTTLHPILMPSLYLFSSITSSTFCLNTEGDSTWLLSGKNVFYLEILFGCLV